jgi:hypothetical protein
MTLAGSFAMFANMNALIFILVAVIEEISKAALFVNIVLVKLFQNVIVW